MNNIFTRYNFTYQKYYVHERKEKGDLPTGRAHTSIEIRNTIFTRKLFNEFDCVSESSENSKA